ncbi:alanine racemase [Neisseria chenwenguii]|uniref:Alanine racemase n=1 Tax=Neisseria chenwenguii TaxID=1853278 RepID=A0A220S063_9NEIS|nr:alanine racemase [Neisseria chenwenguii]ASK26756.1 alanine racemase [Neisseria chenwenguii]ROV56419.1 alanine racemase [Neisseria chenwenguii]
MRPLNAQIRLNNLRHNYQTLKKIHGNKLLAVLKADAYGHGAVRCAHALTDLADGFAVATAAEAVELREAGIENPIVLLEGVFDAGEYTLVDQYRLWPAVGSQWQLEALVAHDWQQPVDVWLKMDSGMHRAGFFPHNYAAAFTALKQCKNIGNIVKFSHFACADEPENGMTGMQLEAFDLACEGLAGEESLANSAAMLNVPAARRDWGRAGLALYGISPFGGLDERLRPVMRLTTRIFAERVLQPHSPIGYGATFYTSKSTRVGLIACGYADGYPRRASTNSPVAVEGKRSRVIGRVSMDMMTVELDAAQEGLGHEVELWGDTVNINEVAEAAGTIPYELMCNVKRAKFTYYE